MNALTLLKQDHQNVDALFRQFEQLGPDASAAEKKDIAENILRHLSIHATVEELVFYPAIQAKVPDAKSAILEALEEHHVAKLSLWEIEKLPGLTDRFAAKVHVLIESVRHHVEEEESELFPMVRDAFTVEELEQLGEQLENAKKTAPNRPHPFQPDVPPLNVILGMQAAVMDRVVTAGKDVFGKVMRRAS